MPSASSTSPHPPMEFQRQIRDEWNAAAPEWARRDLWSYVEQAAQSVNDHLVDLAALRPGHRVLDVGTGVGEPAATAARRVEPDGRVLAVDLAPAMIEAARKRLSGLGFDGVVELRCANGEGLELEPCSLDAVLSRWTLMLSSDFRATLATFRRLLTPGGRLAVALWGHEDRVPFIQLAMDSTMDLLGSDLPETEQGPQHLWNRGRQVLGHLAREAGFAEVRTEAVEVVFEFPDAETYADFITRMAGPIKALTSRVPADVRAHLVGEISRRAEPFRQADGSVRLPNENLILHGIRP